MSPTDTLRMIRVILADHELSATAKIITAAVFLSADNQTDRAWASYRSLRREFGVSTEAICTTLKDPGGAAIGKYLDIIGRGAHGSREFLALCPPKRCDDPTDSDTEAQALRSPERSDGSALRFSGFSASVTEDKLTPETNPNKRASSKDSTPSRKKKTTKTDPRVKPFLGSWSSLYKKHRRTPYLTTSHAKDAALAKKILATLDRERRGENALELLTAAADRLLANPPKWVIGEVSVGVLSKTLNDHVPPKPEPKPADPLEIEWREKFGADFDQHKDDYRAIWERVHSRKDKLTVARMRQHAAKANSDGGAFRAAILKTGVTA